MEQSQSCCPVDELKTEFREFVAEVRGEFKDGRARFRVIDCSIANMTTSVAVATSKVDRVHKTLHEDNGQPAMTTRFAKHEEKVDGLVADVAEIKNRVSEGTKMRWQFWASVAVGAMALLGSLVMAVLNYLKG